jgi:hypothetical protein
MKDRILCARSVFQFQETKVGFCHAHGVPVGWSVFYRMSQQSSSRSFFEYMTEKPKSVFENIMVLKNRGRLFSYSVVLYSLVYRCVNVTTYSPIRVS